MPMSPPTLVFDKDANQVAGDGLIWRSATATDAGPIAAAIETWWARHLRHFVHPLFLEHFGDTCLVVEDEGKLVAFLVGVLSQRHAEEAYVHFLGVHPDYRHLGLGRELYERFAALVRRRGRTVIAAETGAFNAPSIAFHCRLGFTFEDGDELVNGVPVTRDFHATGEDVVRFSLRLEARGSAANDAVE
jgi:ribosomal protein S18 acetylase RimI-like enzyme